jgi:hypothetical protein
VSLKTADYTSDFTEITPKETPRLQRGEADFLQRAEGVTKRGRETRPGPPVSPLKSDLFLQIS